MGTMNRVEASSTFTMNPRTVGQRGFVSFVFLLAASLAVADPGHVSLLRTPDGGIQPQAAIDDKGVVHLIYYKGDAGGGDVFYVRKAATDEKFFAPTCVNSQPGSEIAAETIRGAQLAFGRNNRVHAVWNGGKGAQKVRVVGKDETPLLSTRLSDAGTAFEPERNILTYAGGLDGGSSVAADPLGNVYVTWPSSRAAGRMQEHLLGAASMSTLNSSNVAFCGLGFNSAAATRLPRRRTENPFALFCGREG
jgi:hypothetical protein